MTLGMTTANQLLFYFSAFFAIAFAIGTIASRKPLRAAVSLLGHIISLAALYLTLNAEMLAAIQLLVYAGAIVVLFVFVIMLIGPAAEIPSNPRGQLTRMMSLVVGTMVMATVSFNLVDLAKDRVQLVGELEGYGTVEGMGMAIYSQALVPFEIVSTTLLVAIIGAIAIARSRTPAETAQIKARRAERAALASEHVVDAKAAAGS